LHAPALHAPDPHAPAAPAPALPARRDALRYGLAGASALLVAGCATPAALSRSTAPAGAASGNAGAARVSGDSAQVTGAGASARAGGPTPADWAALARELPSGALVRPGDSRYPAAGHLFQPQFDGVHPAGIAYLRSAHDAATCIAFAWRFHLPLAVRSGGHSYAGWSGTTGMVMDVSALSAVHLSPGRTSATVGAGARLIDVYSGMAAHGVTIPAGSCPTVGVAGLTLGGGVGVTGRAYGLTCDSLTSAQVVTADGRIRTVDAAHDSALFWALRGGGGGNFGVVTSFSFRTHPASACSYAFLSWPWSRAGHVISAWQRWAPSAPDDLWANLHLSAGSDGALSVGIGANLIGGSTTTLENHLDRLVSAVGAQPSSTTVRHRSYLETMQVMGGVFGWSEAQAHLHGTLPGQNPAGRVARQSYAARSDVYTRAIDAHGIGLLVDGVARYARTAPAGGSAAVAFDALGGAINRVRPDATAFVHRNGLFIAQYIANYPGSGVPSGTAVSRSRAWLNGVWTSMRPYASGQAYQNYIDPQLTNWRTAYYGANATRLEAVKRAYDPARVFTFPQAI